MESSIIQVVPRPWPGVERALVIVGSDQRGTIFGAALSEHMSAVVLVGFDVPVRHRDQWCAPG